MSTRAFNVRFAGWALLAAAVGTPACSDDGPSGPRDVIAPTITIAAPADGAVVSPRPSFLIRVSDEGTGVFCSTVRATISGRDFTQFFRNGCDPETGEVRVSGQVSLEEGLNTLVFTVADNAGNEASATRRFTVSSTEPGPPPEADRAGGAGTPGAS